MKGVILWLVLALLLIGCTTKPIKETETQTEKPLQIIENEVVIMDIRSNDFNEGDMIPSKFTCQGEDINPHIEWYNAPDDVKSFALIVDDPDAPAGTWVHWLVKEIPADTKEIQQNSVPGNQVVNDFGKPDYGGPCPPSGVHRYFFRLYALDIGTLLEANDKESFYAEVEKHTIAKAELMGRYQKT